MSARICLYLILLFLPANYTATRSSSPLILADPTAAVSSLCRQLYADMQLDNVVNYTAFEQAITGAQAIERHNKDIITLTSQSLPQKSGFTFWISNTRNSCSHLSSRMGKTAEEIMPLRSPIKSIPTKVHWDFSLRKIHIRAKTVIP